MSDLRTAAQQALEALYEADTFHRNLPDQRVRRLAAMAALRSALAQQDEPEGSVCARCGALAFDPLVPQQDEPVEPVAWMCSSPELMAKGYKRFSSRCEGDWNIPVYTAPPQRKPLTEEVAALTAQRDALLEKIKAVIAAEQSEGAGRGGFVNTPPTREHQRRVAQAWQELHAAIKAVEEAK